MPNIALKNDATRKKPILSERKLLKKIENGFENQEFKMYLQFIMENEEKKIVSAETLSRWEDSTGEVIFPGAYIGLMEKSGLIIKFDYYMFEKVCAKLSEWKNTEFEDLTISCNITRITISEKDFVSKIQEIADKYDFNREKLLIEITEDSLEKNLVIAMYNIIKVKELGFRIALDDFGSGYTSLVSLCEYPIDVVKLDRQVLLLTETEKGKKLFSGIISLAHYLNLKVVCEGVETEEQSRLVAGLGCDFIQGWYYSKPIPLNECEAFIQKFCVRQ